MTVPPSLSDSLAVWDLLLLRAQQSLAANPEPAVALIADGTLDSIIQLVKLHPLNEKILAAAAQALGAYVRPFSSHLSIVFCG